MGFQSTVRYDLSFGVPGEIIVDGLKRVETGMLHSASAAYNIVGATAFTRPVGGGRVAAGGVIGASNVFAGILCNPKTYAALGTSAGGSLAATMTLPNEINAELCLTTSGIVVSVGAACNIGDRLIYNTTTGALSTVKPVATFTGVIAETTGILTVSEVLTGSVGIGTVLKNTSGEILATITALGTGTGGAGTYETNIITAVASGAMVADTVPASGYAFVPNGYIHRNPQTASGGGLALAVLANS